MKIVDKNNYKRDEALLGKKLIPHFIMTAVSYKALTCLE